MSRCLRRLILVSATSLVAALIFLAPAAPAQEIKRSAKTEVKFTVGFAVADEGDEGRPVFGGSFAYHLTPRIVVEPELLYAHIGGGEHMIMVTPNLAVDFRKGIKRFVPRTNLGFGAFHYWERKKTVNAQNKEVVSTSSETLPSVSFGFGVKIFINRRFYVMPEFRLGFPLCAMTLSGGYVLSERTAFDRIP